MSTTGPIWKSRVLSQKLLTPNMLELRLERPANFDYAAGQFIQFRIQENGQYILRAYSLASHPGQADLLFCVKLLPGGIGSTFAANAAPGTMLEWHGPQGRFVQETGNQSLVCIATGAGIAPIFGIIHDELLNKKNTEPIHLLFGVRARADIFWFETLDQLARQFPNFTYQLTLSQADAAWEGKTGRVIDHLHSLPVGSHHFICGSADMVKDVRYKLLERNVRPAEIHFEIF